jgi:transposase
MEACGGAHHWARQFTALGHEVRLIPPAYVKPFVKLQIRDLGEATQRMADFLHSYTKASTLEAGGVTPPSSQD